MQHSFPHALAAAGAAPTGNRSGSFFIQLLEATDTSRKMLEAVPRMDRMIHHGLDRDDYLALLEDLYHVVWCFCPVMGSAASRLGDDYRDIRYLMYDKIAEEKGHEEWVLNDIRAVGGDVDRVRASIARTPVEAFLGYNYAVTDRQHPVAVMGMLYTLEVIASVYAGRVAQSAQDKIGIKGPAGFTFLESHSTMDGDHLVELKEALKGIEDQRVQDAVIRATTTNFWLFAKICE